MTGFGKCFLPSISTLIVKSDRMNGEELATARAVCVSALAPHDASVVAPKSPVEGPGKSRFPRRAGRSSTPIRGRPVFGGEPSPRVPPSLSGPAKRARRSAMEPDDVRTSEPSSANVGGFVLHYATMPALSKEQNSYLASLAEKVSEYLRATRVVRMATIFERGLEDPLMYTTSSLDQSLRGMSAKWKLPLLTFGEKWAIAMQADPTSLSPRLVEVKGDDATLFLQVKDLRDADRVPEPRSRRRSRSHRDRDHGDRDGRRRRRDSDQHDEKRGGRDRHYSPDGSKRSTTGVRSRCVGDVVDVSSSMSGATQLWGVGADGRPCRQSPFNFPGDGNDGLLVHGTGCHLVPGTHCALGEKRGADPAPGGDTPSPPQVEDQIPTLTPDADWTQALLAGQSVAQGEKIDESMHFGDLSPTATWSQPAEKKSQISSSLMPEHLDAVLSDVFLKPVPYSSGCGKWLKAYPLIVQTENLQLGSLIGSGDQVAYMVRVGSPDFCHSCFSLFQDGYSPITCPQCGVPCVPPVQKFVDSGGSLTPELQVLRRYVPRPQDVLSTPQRCTVEGTIGQQFGRFLRILHVDGFSGPNGSNECFLLWDDSRELPEGCGFALFNGLVVGIFLGKPIFGSTFPGSHSALIRRPLPNDDVRFLDLFAGLGGWEYAVELLTPFPNKGGFSRTDFVSVEIDPLCAKVLAHNSQRAVVSPGADSSSVGDNGVVVLGDICDPDWYQLSLSMPFTDILWSAPCQPWSLAGNAMGFSSDLGLLLAHTVGILCLFRPLRAFGENVAGLNMHPQWTRVREILAMLPYHLRIQVTDLKFLSPMNRKRLFIMHQLCEKPQVAPHVDLKPRHWLDAGCGFLNEQMLNDDLLTESQTIQLSNRDLLPCFEKAKARVEGIVDGPSVLSKRIAGPILPTLVASYRCQCELPSKNLREKGLLTWLVSEDRGSFLPRYIDVTEAQRLLGFPFPLLLPEDPRQAMHLLGNAVAPVQGAVILFRVLANCDIASLTTTILHRLYRQPPLRGLCRLHMYGLSRLGVLGVPGLGPRLSVQSWRVSRNTHLPLP